MAKKKKSKAERAYKDVRAYVKDKIGLFGNSSEPRSKHIMEVLTQVNAIMDNA